MIILSLYSLPSIAKLSVIPFLKKSAEELLSTSCLSAVDLLAKALPKAARNRRRDDILTTCVANFCMVYAGDLETVCMNQWQSKELTSTGAKNLRGANRRNFWLF